MCLIGLSLSCSSPEGSDGPVQGTSDSWSGQTPPGSQAAENPGGGASEQSEESSEPDGTGGSSADAVPTEPMCGNNSVDSGELCDGSDLGGKLCASLGFSGGGDLLCDKSCRFDTSACMAAPNSGTLVTETRTLCSDTCWKSDYLDDGRCYDGGPDSSFNTCEFGSDCSDCGPRTHEAPVVSGGGKAACGDVPYGIHEGDPVENWTTYNQYGAAISLSDFCGKWVYIELGRFGCPACRGHAPALEEMANNLKDHQEGLVVVDSLGENSNPIPPNATTTPSVAELASWADEFGQITVHAVCDADYTIHSRYWPFGPGLDHDSAASWGHPKAMLIRPDGAIEYKGQMSEGAVQAAMDGRPYPKNPDREK